MPTIKLLIYQRSSANSSSGPKRPLRMFANHCHVHLSNHFYTALHANQAATPLTGNQIPGPVKNEVEVRMRRLQNFGARLTAGPVKFGGLGLLSFNKIASLAWKSAQESADSFLAKIDLIHPLDPPPTPTPQRVRCAKLWSDQLSSFMEAASQPERKHLAENASKIGRCWLRQIPYFEPLRLSNHEVAAGLHYRLLTPAYSPVCAACANESDLGHDKVCRLRETWSIRRHDPINRVLHSYLSPVAGAVIALEPSTQTGRRRNDLRMRGGGVWCATECRLRSEGLRARGQAYVRGRWKREAERDGVAGLGAGTDRCVVEQEGRGGCQQGAEDLRGGVPPPCSFGRRVDE
ncbi:hypothetical protein L202_06744 [Cryptococcus amylolentus CBS 6039]|uniref:Uncharacterized protein n=1 Tax=Cryptococcus amylolentus CBS 6039 TaxID=1295533 RepID=A0A1E3HDB7_9TREE|nr:hypothetical protein L202_06744 [Cryptococcus amylolentus CBS 6039]ODN74327.1 hypothetical protein L202_06744 [Cryptococcus amylolentus CBS 6039]